MRRTFVRLFSAIAACAFGTAALTSYGLAQTDPAPSPRVTLILSHLPLKTSRAYHRLRKAAGDATGELLPMTRAEIWSMPAKNASIVRELAKKLGVGVREVAETDMSPLAPTAPDRPMTRKQSDMMNSAIKDKSSMGVTMMALPEASVLEYALTRGLDKTGLDAPAISLKLSNSVSVSVRRTDIVKDGDSYIWQGEVEGTGEPVTLVCWPQGRIAGTIQYAGRIYKIQSMGEGLHGIIEIAPQMLPPEHAPMDGAMREKMKMKDDPLAKRGDAGELMKALPETAVPVETLRDVQPKQKNVEERAKTALGSVTVGRTSEGIEPVGITLIVAYTKAAANHYADIGKDLITLAVAEANQSFKNSGIGNVQVRIVHTYQTNYVENGTHFEHMFQFAEKGDGIADEIHKLRDKHKADIALMIVDDANGCGLSAGVAPPADRAFAVVHHGCAATSYSLAHEIGHIIGARHDLALDENKTPFPFGHGFVYEKKWRTMMSYEQSCDGCPRLPLWSNPDVRVQGEAAGSELANNARVIREGAKRVAAFR